ncbi:MAG: hypothetical protein VB078_03480 [Clostridiaceae bacterium]|nr:hypothetical protein [Clostridiaceae bacterium]
MSNNNTISYAEFKDSKRRNCCDLFKRYMACYEDTGGDARTSEFYPSCHCYSGLCMARLCPGFLTSWDLLKSVGTYISWGTTAMTGCTALGILLLAADLFLSKKLVHDTSKGQIPQLLRF